MRDRIARTSSPRISWCMRIRPGHPTSLICSEPIADLDVQLLVVPENPHLIERNPAIRSEIRSDTRAFLQEVVHRNDAWVAWSEPRHRPRKGVAQALDDLEQGKIRIGSRPAGQVLAGAPLQHSFEIAEIFRRAGFQKILRAPARLLALVLVIEARRDRMMGVVTLDDEIRDGELQLMDPL